jgi:hypothetical protein
VQHAIISACASVTATQSMTLTSRVLVTPLSERTWLKMPSADPLSFRHELHQVCTQCCGYFILYHDAMLR